MHKHTKPFIIKGVEVIVDPRDKSLRNAIQDFKKEMKKAGVMQELRDRESYTPPSLARRQKRAKAQGQRVKDARRNAKKAHNNVY